MPPKLRFRGQEVEWQTRVRYLGVQIDRSIHMVTQVEHVIRQSRVAKILIAEPRGAYCAQFSHRIYRSEPKSPCIKTTSIPSLRTRLQHSTHSVPHRKGRGSSPAEHRPTDGRGSGTRIARRMCDIADQGPYEFSRNIAPMHERSPSSRPLLRELLKTPPPKN
ncbi:hypothetical protein EVAR_99024_1 [Eumeta japonica]|uniref:Uncharacterized protein n=1 Tax=Eumeta variegata TaxID=151549 RepID=A0A4C1Y1A5_EUMVA|nr:hypothetical protein EVAR_99024_1 [Eumeta japonica]